MSKHSKSRSQLSLPRWARWAWFGAGTMSGAMALSLSLASVRPGSVFQDRVTDDTALYQELSEIRSPKHAKIDFDSDIAHLTKREKRYREKLPKLSQAQASRLVKPLMRIEKRTYSYRKTR